jgi:hypothetical protein
MHTSQLKRWCGTFVAGFAAAIVLFAASPSSALQAALNVELDTGLMGNFATVDIVEDCEGLHFSISLDPSLGGDPDLHTFYFNIASPDLTDLRIETDDAYQTAYKFKKDPSVAGGAGSEFDYEVNFGNGAGPHGNGQLQTATFSLYGNRTLTIEDLYETSFTSQGIEIQFALHAQGTALFEGGADSEAVGAKIVPEPSTALLACVGLLGLAAKGRKQRPHRRA